MKYQSEIGLKGRAIIAQDEVLGKQPIAHEAALKGRAWIIMQAKSAPFQG